MKKILCLLSFLVISNVAFAGAPVSGADVEITNTTTGKVIKTKTDALGNFSSCDLPTGTYSVCCTINGKKFDLPSNETGGKYDVQSPRDLATGQASGKRMHKPITITKELDKSTVTVTCADGCCKGQINTSRSNIKTY